ncbi:MAG: hypothetical protein GF334_12520 [Candidatus Altiarchaeales archaeon]|nr:hypothetical protein [Candidatus Altiarchaeales archaeon]
MYKKGTTKDLTGLVVGRLRVVSFNSVRNDGKKNRFYWNCICSCGKEVVVRSANLTGTRTKTISCGCYNKERTKEANRGNKYGRREWEPIFVLDFCLIPLSNCDACAIIDRVEYEKVKNYSWYKSRRGYVVSNKVPLHRLIMNPSKREDVDHINHDLLLNTKDNLRVCSHSENCKNRSNSIGVHYLKRNQKWTAYVHDKQRIYLGLFDTEQEAFESRKKAEDEIYGEYSYDKSMGRR